ncbi:MAG: hypothetical protein IAC06_02080 [Bacteroidetes bacterium]|uniref:Uncharacterized protein n=1 Tax=Candidatus Cryptobacteroides intestinavium TaxID=2840766 RepID=A0A9D9ER92_9BACT|nr:hypothetical protein [Candidatus Cryptobacteroides intestinavium]
MLRILHSACRSFTPPAATFRMTDNGFVQDECSVPDPSLPLRMTRAATLRMTRAAAFRMTRAAASVVT